MNARKQVPYQILKIIDYMKVIRLSTLKPLDLI